MQFKRISPRRMFLQGQISPITADNTNDQRSKKLSEKPVCKMTNGNTYAMMVAASRALKRAGLYSKVEPMKKEILSASSYEEAKEILEKYVEIE